MKQREYKVENYFAYLSIRFQQYPLLSNQATSQDIWSRVGYLVDVWVFGREYSDRTMKDLLALPTPRWAIIAAKFSVVVVWCAALAAMMYALGFAVGAAVDIPQWSQ